ncbi:MAG: hypothetical protein KU37_11800 [Sulfuricurvum sp. PC08-66]|nr:MAG: hypothetical protein KU37_11800 [Sulfuricurvum sp. PC08-66]
MIREAKSSDVEAIYHIEKTMFKDEVYFGLQEAEIAKLIRKKSTKLFVYCDENDRAVGYALALLVGEKGVWFNSLAVLQPYHSTNAAKLLFQEVEAIRRTKGSTVVILEIRKDNRALERRYKNLGYTVWKEIEAYYPDGCGAYRMTKCFSKA